MNIVDIFKDFLDGGSAHRNVATYIRQHEHRKKANIYIHALSCIRTHDASVRKANTYFAAVIG
jgi:hypothetical protein